MYILNILSAIKRTTVKELNTLSSTTITEELDFLKKTMKLQKNLILIACN